MSTGTQYPDVWAALAAPFLPAEVKARQQGGRQLSYITARTAMNRLDAVLGPENWWDRLTMLSDDSFLCELSIRLPDGRTLTKSDVGGMAGMQDAGDDDKSGASDAFKRAAVKFGVARYLYRDGVPSYVDGDRAPAPARAGGDGKAPIRDRKPAHNRSGHGKGTYASPTQVIAYNARLAKFVEAFNAKFLDSIQGPYGDIPVGIADPVAGHQITGHMLKWALRNNLLAEVPFDFDPETGAARAKVGNAQRDKLVALVFARHEAEFMDEVKSYARRKADVQRAKIPAEPKAEDQSQEVPDDLPDEPGMRDE